MGESKNANLFRHRLANGEYRWVEVFSSPVNIGDKVMQYSIIHDVNDRFSAETERMLAVKFLQIINTCHDIPELLSASVDYFHRESFCEAVGIRLKNEGDYPYAITKGFTDAFVNKESSLCTRDRKGKIVRRSDKTPVMECLCGEVISGYHDPLNRYYSTQGSFWTNSMSELTLPPCEKQEKTHFRFHCGNEGFESVALIPLQMGSERLGLLQMNERRKNHFTQEMISIIERLASYLSVALLKMRMEEEKQNAEKSLKQYAEKLEEMVMERTFDIQNTNSKLSVEITERIAIEEMLRKQTESLEKYRYRLQEMVKERTAELESNNFKLAKEIVDRRTADRALTESERKFREIAQNLPGMIFQLRVKPDGSNYFSYISPRASEIFDLSQELSGIEEVMLERIHPMDKTSFLASVSEVINHKKEWNYEGRILKYSGEIKWFHGFTTPGHIAEELVLDGIMLDITDRKMIEEELRISIAKYRILFDSFPFGLMVSNSKGKIIESNKEAERLLGISHMDMIDRSINSKEWNIIRPDGTPMPAKEFASVRALKSHQLVENVEMGIVRENKDITWINVSAYPLPVKNYGVMIIYNDVTLKKE